MLKRQELLKASGTTHLCSGYADATTSIARGSSELGSEKEANLAYKAFLNDFKKEATANQVIGFHAARKGGNSN